MEQVHTAGSAGAGAATGDGGGGGGGGISDGRRDGRTRTRIPGMIRLTLVPIWPACAVRALVVHPAAAGSVLLLVQVVGAQGRPADIADTVVRWLAGVGTPLGRPVVPVNGVPHLAHVAVPEVAGASSAAVQPHRVGLCMAPPQQFNGIWPVVTVDCAPVGKAAPIVMVAGDGLRVAQRASARY
jgi:hypothetical protein